MNRLFRISPILCSTINRICKKRDTVRVLFVVGKQSREHSVESLGLKATRFVLVAFSVLLAFSSTLAILYTRTERAYAATNSNINFQARVLTAAGGVVPDGAYNVQFNLYSVASAGSTLWTETYLNSATQGIVTKNGYITASLGSLTAFPNTIPWDQELWIGMTIRGTGSCAFAACTPADAEMNPRMKVTAVPYAFRAAEATELKTINGANVSTLNIAAPTGGSQVFVVPDQGAAGTYNLLTQNTANANYIQNQSSTPQTANYYIQSAGSSTVGAIVRGAVGQTAALMRYENSAGNTLAVFGANGQLTLGNDTGTPQLGSITFNDNTGSNGFTAVLTSAAALTANVTYRLPASAAGSYDICTSSGNCLGGGDIIQNGNTYATAINIGSNDNYDVNIETFGVNRLTVQNDGDVAIDTNTLFVDAANDRVGIGNTGSTGKLSVSGATSSLALFESTGANNAYISIASPAGQQSGVQFVTNGTTRFQLGAQTDNTFFLYDGANVRDAINITTTGNILLNRSGGNVGIGNASAPNRLSINTLTSADATAQIAVSTAAAGNKGLLVQASAAQTASLLELQNSAGTVLSGFNATGNLFYSNSTFASVLSSAALTANRSIVLPNEDGTICLQNSTNCGFALASGSGSYVQFAGASAQTDATNNASIFINKTSGTGNILQLQKSGTNVMTLSNTGALVVQNSVDSTSAFQIRTSTGGTNVAGLNYDTTNQTLSLRNSNDAATVGAELFTGSYSFPATAGWSAISGTGSSATATHSTGNSNSLYASPSFTPVAGATYQISFDTSGSPALNEYMTVAIGAAMGVEIYGNQAGITQVLTATSTGQFVISPTNGWTGTISNLSIKRITRSSPVLQVLDSTGASQLEMRVGGAADSRSTFIGQYSGQANANTGYFNTGFGSWSLSSNTTGSYNTAVGNGALTYNTVGSSNAAFGESALYSNTTGSSNTGYGTSSLFSNTTGSNNVAIGSNSLYGTTLGSNNTALGTSAGDSDNNQSQFMSLNNLQGSTMLGAYSQAFANNVLALGGQGTNSVKVGIGTGLPTNQLSAEAYRYSTGTVDTNGTTTITGSGTTFTANMVGNVIYIASNDTNVAPYVRTITGYTSATSINVNSSVPALSGAEYYINYAGLQVQTNGNVAIGALTGSSTLSVLGTANFTSSTNSATAFQVQDSGTAALFTANTLTRTGGVAGNVLKVGNSTGTDTNTTLLVLDGATAAPTTNLASLNGGLYYDTTTNKVSAIENGVAVQLCSTGTVCAGYAPTPASGSYIKQVPASTAENTITPTVNSVVGLTVNGTSGTAATALSVSQPGVAAGITVTSANNTATNGLSFSGTFSNYISAPNFSVTNAGAITAVGVNSGTGLLQGTGGITVTGATNVNTSGANATNIGTGVNTGTISIGNTSAGALTLQSGAGVTISGAAASSFTTTTGNLTLDSAAVTNLGTSTATAVNIGRTGITTTNAGALTVSQLLTGNLGATISGGTISLNTSGTANTAIGNATGTFAITSNGGLNVTTAGAVTASNLTLQGTTTTNFATPQGANVPTKINIPTYDPGAFGQILAFGLPNTADSTSRAISVFDNRAGTHQPTLAVFNPAESTVVGFNWNGSNTVANVQTMDMTGAGGSAQVALRSGNSTVSGNTGDVSVLSGNATSGNSGFVIIDAGTASGTVGNVSIGVTNAAAITLGRAGITTTNAGALTVTQLLTGNLGATITGAAINLNATGTAATTIGNSTGTLALLGGNSSSLVIGTGANTTTVNFAAPSGNNTISFPAASGTVLLESKLTTNGDLLYNNGTIVTRLARGGNGDCLTSNATTLVWLSCAAGTTLQNAYDNSTGGIITVTATDGALRVRDASSSFGSSSIFAVQNNAGTADYFAVTGAGNVVFDSVDNVMYIDETNNRVGINTGAPSADLSFGSGANRNINVVTTSTNAAGFGLTVSAGAAGAGASAFGGGALTLQGGAAAGTGNANGGGVTVTGGVGTGTGVLGLVSLAPTTFASAGVQTFAVSGALAAGLVDTYSTIPVNVTNTAVTISVPDPNSTMQSIIGRVLYLSARGTASDFTLTLNSARIPINIAMKANSTATLIWNGTDWTAAGASSSTTLQAAYDNTLTAAGGAEIILNNTSSSNGLTVRNNSTTPIIGGIFEAQTSIGTNLFSVNNNATEYATNGGAETVGASASTFPVNTWSAAPSGGTVDRYTTAGDNIATGQASVRVQTTTAANTGVANRLTTTLTANQTYSVAFAVRAAANFATLQAVYSPDGTNTGTVTCATGATATSGGWTRIDCTFVASGSITANNAIIIRQTDAPGAGRTFYVENLSVNINASATFAADGSVDNAGAFATNWTAYGAGSTAARDTAVLYDSSASARVDTTNTADRGIRNNLAITPSTSTQYLVSFYAKTATGNVNDLTIRYSRDGGTTLTSCVDYSTQVITTTTWTKVSCLFTTDGTTATNPDLIFTQATAPGGTRAIYIDALSVTLNTNNSSNVQIGGGNEGGPTTLFTLDRASSAPIAGSNDAYLGSMYYDTTSGRIQCYEADGWGACGSAPDNIVNLNPEYAGAVLNGTGIGTMTADFCGNGGGLAVNTGFCASGEARNFYKWTSPQATQQTYSIYVTYQLPSSFKGFANDDTVQLTARTDNTTNGIVSYQMYRNESGVISACGTETTVTSSANTWQTAGINGNEATGCSFTTSSANAFVIFKINVKANSNASVYVGTLSFTTTGR